MHGPTPAAMFCARAPRSTMAATVASRIPARAPRQPACAAPITPAAASANNTGTQSAVRMPRATPLVRVASPSTWGRSSAVHGFSITAIRPECT